MGDSERSNSVPDAGKKPQSTAGGAPDLIEDDLDDLDGIQHFCLAFKSR